MWFKNLKLYRFTQDFRMDAEVLAEKLAEQPFKSCGKLEASSYGFVAPIGGAGAPLVHSTSGCLLFATCREERSAADRCHSGKCGGKDRGNGS